MTRLELPSDLAVLDTLIAELPDRPALFLLWPEKGNPFLARTNILRQRLTLQDFAGFLFHPGGRKVLECLQGALGLTPADLAHSWGVLKEFGNMSSATALFVLERAIGAGATGRHLLGAFGPGFSAYFAVLDL